MRVKTSEATPLQVNYLVAKCKFPDAHTKDVEVWIQPLSCDDPADFAFEPSTNWSQGGPIIEREKISIEYMVGAGAGGLDVWVATRIKNMALSEECAPTPLVAAMRCYVASRLGDEVDVPDELVVTDDV